jgi:hypothetical protein
VAQSYGKTRRKSPLERSVLRWEDNIKMVLKEIGYGIVDLIHLAQGRDQWQAFVNILMNLQVP